MPAAASAMLRQLKLLFAANPGATVCSGRLEPSPFSDLMSSSMIARMERRPRGAGCAKGPSRVNLQQFHNFSPSPTNWPIGFGLLDAPNPPPHNQQIPQSHGTQQAQ